MASEIKVDTISEKTSAGGVTIDGLLIKDGGISGDVSLIGTTPTFTIGDAGAEDATLLFDGNAQDFHIGLDDTADDLVIGVGSTLGTTTAIAIDENANTTFSGTVTVGVDDAGHDVKFFGDTASAYMLWDTSADDLVLAGAAGIDLAGDIDVDGTANLDVVDIDGAVDMASTLQVDGVITTSDGMIITTADNTDTLSLISTDADANVGPNVKLYRNSSSPAADDLLGAISFAGEDDGGNDTEYALIDTVIGATTGGSENGRIRMKIQKGGTLSSGLDINADVIIINDDSKDIDFRVESDGNANMLTVNAGSNIVGIGADPDLGVGLHIKTADSGASVDANGDELVIENSGNTGLTILSGTSSTGGIYFGDSGSSNIGYVEYLHNGNSLDFGITSTRMRITSGGDVGIGATAASPNPNFYFQSGSNAQLHIGHDSNCASGQAYQAFFYDGSAIGTITQNGTTAVAYNTSSDYRLKENETAITDGITRIKQLKPYRFNFKTDADTTLDGFFAHEVSSIVPEAISGEKDAMIPEVLYTDEILYTDEDTLPEGKNIGDVKHSIGDVKEATKINPQGIDQSKLVPLLTSALQEAITKIETLEAKVAVLEG